MRKAGSSPHDARAQLALFVNKQNKMNTLLRPRRRCVVNPRPALPIVRLSRGGIAPERDGIVIMATVLLECVVVVVALVLVMFYPWMLRREAAVRPKHVLGPRPALCQHERSAVCPSLAACSLVPLAPCVSLLNSQPGISVFDTNPEGGGSARILQSW